MELWIEETSGPGDRVTVRLAGRLAECEVDRLAERLGRVDPRRLEVDLEGLTFLGTRGAELLRGVRGEGGTLVGCSPLVSDLIGC